ncbi:S9 family peptidase [Vibrio anguillarum]|uniref:prolyl oligopeptidase family serine peptidase n=1 Tax=Vibrio anguillarum TaxID=55601 RepID=UPI00030219A2|nr:prolyl oligopeptidase family serine peptidase [Vibrio anguillarum]ATA51558.1 S9 family peptidase [Vibrio anguillarum]AXN09069.1 S9 family peptidase [Vibrio anguillarum]AXN12678.1 S9 family peptidase [Vibrio anguillarum]AXN16080.1 S9 family peptidase [Vibrio anguillarum]AXN19278.1 S9 family peptidase [Vibrio anguillarum]
MKLLNIIAFVVGLSCFHSSYGESLQWLEDGSRRQPKVRAHLEDHNKKTQQWLNQATPLSNALVKTWSESKSVKAPTPWLIQYQNYYHDQVIKGERFVVKKTAEDSPIERLVNISVRQQQSDYYQLANWAVAKGDRFIALSEDLTGEEHYTLTLLDRVSKLEIVLSQSATTQAIWSENGQYLYFLAAEESRSSRLLQRYDVLSKQTKTLWEWADPQWIVSLYLAADPHFALVQVNNENSSEQRILETNSSHLSLPLRAAQPGIEYYADVANGWLYINSNLNGKFALYRRLLSMNENPWQLFYAPDDHSTLDNFYLYQAGVVVKTNQAQHSQLAIMDQHGKLRASQPLATESEVAWVSRNGDWQSNKLRVRSMSMVSAGVWREFDVASLQWKRLGQDHYPAYLPEQYESQQIVVDVDGVAIPVTLAYRKDTLSAQSSVFLYGYGAYGVTMRPYFMPQVISLLDQGVIYAIAHVRGGGYHGESWHRAGSGILKKIGISDFLNVASSLQHFNNGQRAIYAIGGSAGGTLVAAAVNQNPALFAGVVLQVPFVDVLRSMSTEDSSSLSVQQREEWGDPRQPLQRSAIEAYDPLLNIQAKPYPPTLVRVGWFDNRVPYWEGAKYIEKMSMMSTGIGPYLLWTDFNSGHSSDSRKALQQQAVEYAFLLTIDKNKKAEQ